MFTVARLVRLSVDDRPVSASVTKSTANPLPTLVRTVIGNGGDGGAAFPAVSFSLVLATTVH